MPFANALSTANPTPLALDDVLASIGKQFSGTPDLAMVFFSPHHAEHAETIATTLSQKLQPRCLLGCIGESIVGGEQEIEHQPALSLWLASWSAKVDTDPFHLALEHTPDGATLLGWPDSLENADLRQSAMLLVADPFTFPAELLLRQANEEHKGLRIMGGMASGVRAPGQARLILGDRVVTEGGVGVLLHGVPMIRSIVSQGCRPIGKHYVITGGQENIVTGLGGKTPLEQLRDLYQELPARD
jgi:small ligand-binding sensory domain FIST